MTGLKGGLESPLLWGPVLGIAVVLARVHLPSVVAMSLELIGSATSGVAVFSVGLVLAAYPVRLSAGVFAGSLARVTVQSADATAQGAHELATRIQAGELPRGYLDFAIPLPKSDAQAGTADAKKRTFRLLSFDL